MKLGNLAIELKGSDQVDLQFSRDFLRSLCNTFDNGVLIVNPFGQIVLVNQVFSHILNIEETAVLGQDIQDIVPKCQLKSVMTTGLQSTNNIYKMNGRLYKADYFPLLLESRLLGGAAIFEDITNTEKIIGELKEVNTYKMILEAILQNVYEGIIIVDKNGKVLMFNGAYADFLNIKPEAALGKPIAAVIKDSPMREVMAKGVADVGSVQRIGSHNAVVKNLPIKIDEEVVAGVSNIWFRDLKDVEVLYRRLSSLEDELAYYKEELRRKQGSKYTLENIIGDSPAITQLKNWIHTAAKSTSTVLILGESGTGKELVAHAIHDCSNRRHQPFVRINCAAIPENILESELFGYAAGAFTGAQKGGKIGKFEMAHKGTVFLDEIGDMSFHMQAKLLRFLQEKELERLGENKMRQVDVRVVAATNQNLQEKIKEGQFREDLYYRLQVITLDVPPLRQHQEDIPQLIAHFINKYSGELCLEVAGIRSEASAQLLQYNWPGNIRQLENVIQRACNLLEEDKYISLSTLPAYLTPMSNANSKIPKGSAPNCKNYNLLENKHQLEKESILQALLTCNNNRTQASKLLGITRTALYQKLKKYSIE